MASPRLHRTYTITTTVEKTEDEHGDFAVFDTARFGSSPENRIARFKGTEEDCLAYGNKLAEYWRRALEKTPSLDD